MMILDVMSSSRQEWILSLIMLNLVWTSLLGSKASSLAFDMAGRKRIPKGRDIIVPLALFLTFMIAFAFECGFLVQLLDDTTTSDIGFNEWPFLTSIVVDSIVIILLQICLVQRIQDVATWKMLTVVPVLMGSEITQLSVTAFFAYLSSYPPPVLPDGHLMMPHIICAIGSLVIPISALSPVVAVLDLGRRKDVFHGRPKYHILVTGTYASTFFINACLLLNTVWLVTSKPSPLQPMCHIASSKAYMSTLTFLLYLSDERTSCKENICTYQAPDLTDKTSTPIFMPV